MNMKRTKTLIWAAAAMLLPTAVAAQTTIFCETFDTASSEKDELIEDHEWTTNGSSYFSWSVNEYLEDGTEDTYSSLNVRTNNPSDYTGASADGNLYFKGVASFTISGISTQDYSDITLSIGGFGKNKSDIELMTLTIDADGTTSSYDFADLSFDATKKTWSVVTISDIPQASSLSLTFTSALAIDEEDDGGIRLDDITLAGTSASSGTTSISDVEEELVGIAGRTVSYNVATGKAEIYDLSGHKVATVVAGDAVTLSEAGVYVIRTNSTTRKYIVR